MKEPKLWLCPYDIHFPQYDRGVPRDLILHQKKQSARTAPRQRCARPELRQPLGNKDLPGNKRKGELRADLDGFDKQILQPLELCYHAAARRCSSQATHERMLDQDRTESMPELDGMIDFKQPETDNALGI